MISGICSAESTFGQSQGLKSSVRPTVFPFRLKVPAQMVIVCDEVYWLVNVKILNHLKRFDEALDGIIPNRLSWIIEGNIGIWTMDINDS